MKRVLVISYYWPPTGGSGVQRWVKFAKYLPSEGWQPVIYTPLNPEQLVRDERLGDEIPAEAEVVRRRIAEPYSAYRFLTGQKPSSDGGSAGGEVNPLNAGEKTAVQKIAMWVRANLFIPDPRRLWVRPSVRFLREYLRSHPVDVIVTTGPPHSMHLIGRALARRTGLPWIADFRDPWTGMFYFKHLPLSAWARKRHDVLEQRVLDSASVVVAVSPAVQDGFRAMTGTQVELITNGYDEEDYAGDPPSPDGNFNVVHTGLFAADGDPRTFWAVLAQRCGADPLFKSKLRVRLVGKTDSQVLDSVRAFGLGDNVVDRGYVTHAEAVREQRRASLLLLPLRKEPEYKAVLPGKVFEYLAAGKPVLGIGQPDGAMASLLKSAGAGLVADWDDAETMDGYVEETWSKFLAGGPLGGPADLGRYSRRRLACEYAALMDSLIK